MIKYKSHEDRTSRANLLNMTIQGHISVEVQVCPNWSSVQVWNPRKKKHFWKDKLNFQRKIFGTVCPATSRPYCSSGRTQIVISPDGKVTTCEQSPQEGEFVCGDATKQSIMEVWNSDALKKWFEPPREYFLGTVCYDCNEFEPCIHGMGHCWLHVLKMQGRLWAPHPYCPKSEKPKQRWR